jgi:hypothetical protein
VYALNGATLVGSAASAVVATAANLGAPPNQLQAQGAPTATTLGLQWQNTASALATGYQVQQCTGTAANCKIASALWTPAKGNMVVGAANTKFTATGLTKGTYSFHVRAVNTLVPPVNGEPGLTSTTWSAPFAMKTL